jgi:hypothetical protein
MTMNMNQPDEIGMTASILASESSHQIPTKRISNPIEEYKE